MSDIRIKAVDIADRMETSFLDYSMSVIVSRALPDIRDGLKPVQRRILYAMFEAGLLADRSHRKCASVVGDVMKKYHPHGDSSIYDALVRMAQPFSTREPLISGRGNFGSIDGDPPAAFRYTEARLSPLAMHLLADIRDNTVDFEPNYDGHEEQPSILPARFPNLIVNGSSGIAVGFATSIPPHNLGEAIEACKVLIKDPKASLSDVMEVMPAPDFPTGARIVNPDDLAAAYETGRGSVQMEAVAATETRSGGLPRIVITEIPYQVNKANLHLKINDLVRNRKLDGIRDTRDESSRDGMRLVIELKRGEDPTKMLEKLYSKTELRSNFSINMVALKDGRPQTFSLLEMLHAYIDHQKEVLTRRTQYRLDHALDRLHVIEGLLIALDNIDEVIAIIRNAPKADVAKENLMERFSLSERQAVAILDMQLRRLAQLEASKLRAEAQELRDLVARLQAILDDPKKLDELLVFELDEIAQEFSNPRRSLVINKNDENYSIDTKLLAAQDVTVYISKNGYMKPVAQKPLSAPYNHKEELSAVIKCSGEASLFAVDITGQGVRFSPDEAGVLSIRQRGVQIEGVENPIAGVIELDVENDSDKDIICVTRDGFIKRSSMSEYDSRTRQLVASSVREGDEIISALTATEDDNILLASNKGQAIVFSISEIRPTGRATSGVVGMKIPDHAHIVSASIIREDADVIVLSQNGAQKRVPVSDFPIQGRNGKGVLTGVSNLAYAGSCETLHVQGEDGWQIVRPETLAPATRSKTPDPNDSQALGTKVISTPVAESESISSF